MIRRKLSSSLLFLLPVSVCMAQEPEGEQDSIRTYRLGEVVITSEEERRHAPATMERVAPARISRLDAATVSDVARAVTGARVQTNSRGEALIYIRNAGERQVGLFFDGASMNVPWDYRLDVSLVPAGAIGGITVAKGVPSVLYGVNVLGGAINIVSQELSSAGHLTELTAIGGQNEYLNASLLHAGNTGSFNYIGTLSTTRRAGIPVPEGADLPFNQDESGRRTNTDLRSTELYLRGEYRFSPGASLGLSVNYIDARKGVAPESHKPDSLGPRFWRYPDWTNLTVTMNGDLLAGAGNRWDLRWALWGTGFHQAIDQFRSATYQSRSARQEDRDFTLGGRVVLRHELAPSHTLDLAVNALQSTHRQTDLKFDKSGALTPYADTAGVPRPYPELLYRQQLYSAGLEYNGGIIDRLRAMVGLGWDGMSTPKTGDKPESPALSDVSASAGLAFDVTDRVVLRASAGRKTRFPTMRELYGEALNRFLLNPDLKPESALLTELGAGVHDSWGSASVAGYATFVTNTIDQKNVTTPSGRKRQRVNLEGSRIYGAELTASVAALRPFRLDANVAYSHARGLANEGDSTFRLAEKPELLATVEAGYDFPFGLQPTVELVHTGEAYSLNDEGELVPLEASTAINLRLAYRLTLPVGGGLLGQIFLRANNVTDAVVTPQLGLPAAGREIQAGIKLAY